MADLSVKLVKVSCKIQIQLKISLKGFLFEKNHNIFE